ncbi:MAG: HEAT repeat domain-containing protein [Deltaproteobacteria bacterium]|nr:HEAT repeat domain-containing protein [Deltaproteobacteria bacterium]
MTHARWLWVGIAIVIASSSSATGQPAKKGPAKGAAKKVDVSAEAIAALGGTDVQAAAKAAEQLGASALPAAHDGLLEALALGLHAAVAVPAIDALVLHPAPPDVLALRRYAGHVNPAVRSAAINALASYPDPKAHAVVVGGLRDPVGSVRTASANAAGRAKIKLAIEPMMQLFAKGEESSARALAALADPDLARKLAEQLGKVPDATLVIALAAMLKRSEFGPDAVKVEIVRAMGKIQDASALAALTDYIDATPKTPARTSRQEAVLMVEARMGGK